MSTGNRSIERPRAGEPLPRATVKKSRLSWWLWLIPAGAAAICVWFVYRDYVSTGPLITIEFQNAQGLETENTKIMYRGASVGAVKGVAVATDDKSVKVQARLAGSARNLARTGAIFWIVRPELRMGAISGLRTIVSGEYIEVQPGSGVATNYFIGSEKQPIPNEPNALHIVFTAPSLGSLREQTPIYYRGVEVGEVVFYQLASDSREVRIHAHIWEEYAPLVRVDSKFWNAGGLDVHMGIFKGVQISAESPRTLLSGGIEFATPPEAQIPATNGTTYVLNEKPLDKWKTWEPIIDLHIPPHAAQTNSPAPSSSPFH